MGLFKRLELFFISLIFLSIGVIAYNYYESYKFDHEDIPQSYKDALAKKEDTILDDMQKHYGFKIRFPVIISNKMPGKIFGLTSLNEQGAVVIYLNKKVMKESFDYIVEDVLPHEYAHALLLRSGDTTNQNGGHTKKWQIVCQNLGGKNCERYVDANDVVMGKLKF